MADPIYLPYDLFLTGHLSHELVLPFQIALREAQREVDDDYPLRVNISCDGGEMDLTLAIVSQIHEYRRQGRKIITHANGGTYSGGVTILQAGDYRTMDEFAMLMVHEPQISFDNWENNKTAAKQYISVVEQTFDKHADIIATRTGHDKSYILQNFFNSEDNYFDAGTALEYGLIDAVVYAP